MHILTAIRYATSNDLFAVFLLVQFTFFVTYRALNSENKRLIPWLCLFILCLTYCWDGDFYSYWEDFNNGMVMLREKEQLYYSLYRITNPHYFLWRSLVWGGAIAFFIMTLRRLKINSNIAVYVLIFLYLPLFVYGRVILAMTIYFFGLSFIIKPIGQTRFLSFILGFVIAALSYFAHRTFLPLIALFPLLAISPKRIHFVIGIVLIPVFIILLRNIFSAFAMESVSLGDAFESFQYSAERATSGILHAERNMRSIILYWTRNISLYLPALYFLWLFFRGKLTIEKRFLPLLTVSVLLVLLSLSLYFGVKGHDMDVISKRYLFMAGIPECLLLAISYQNQIINKKTLNLLLLLGFIATEASIVVPYLLHGYDLAK